MDGAHAASCEEMATAMSTAEAAAYKGLQQCIETVMAEVCSCLVVFYFNIAWIQVDTCWSLILHHSYLCGIIFSTTLHLYFF